MCKCVCLSTHTHTQLLDKKGLDQAHFCVTFAQNREQTQTLVDGMKTNKVFAIFNVCVVCKLQTKFAAKIKRK